ncbi:MAG: ATP-binding protein [Pseudomonadota bacterium]
MTSEHFLLSARRRSVSPSRLWREGAARDKAAVLAAWLATIGLSIALGLVATANDWSGLPLRFAGTDIYVTVYPPLVFALLWTVWFGFWWGFIPAYLATLVLALQAGMEPAWAAVFAFADPIGLAVFAIAYAAIPVDSRLRSPNSLLLFVLLSFVSGIFGSAGAFIWIGTTHAGLREVLPIWQGWWLGAFLQSVLIAGPLLYLLGPAVDRWRARRDWARPEGEGTPYSPLAGAATILAGVLLFLFLTARLNLDAFSSAGSDPAAIRKAAQALADATGAVHWIVAAIIVFAAYFGTQLFVHWSRAARVAAQELSDAHARLNAVMDSLDALVFVSDMKSQDLLYLNPASRRILGRDQARTWRDVLRPQGDFDPDDHLTTESGSAKGWVLREFQSGRDGRWYELQEQPIRWVDGRPARFAVAMDITRLQQARARAEEATRAKSAFLATMSHDIRTPMNGIVSMAEILGQTPLSREQKGMVDVLRDCAESLLSIINDVLDFSKIEAGRLDLETIELSLADVVESVAGLVYPRAAEKGLAVLVWVDPSVADRRMGDPNRLRQILLNLAGNAVKFTHSGRVEIEVTEEDGAVRFAVRDTGIGLSDEQQVRLFQPFSQADASMSRRFGGTGLGLSISRRLVRLMGGAMGVTSRLGGGACFWFKIPLPPVTPAAPPPCPELSGVRVLVVAPAGPGPAPLARYLAHTGADVVMVGDAGEAWARLADGPPAQVVVVDLSRVPGGAELLRGLAAEPRLAGARAVALMSLAQVSGPDEPPPAFAILPHPLRRQALWTTVAAAAGRGEIEAHDGPLAPAPAHFLPPSAEEARAARCLILVAEDNPTNQMVMERVMERLGYAAVVAGNGLEALKALEAGGVGLLLTDCHMPEMDGYQLSRAIRAKEAEHGEARLPIVALTADAIAGTEDTCKAAGMDCYLTKPVDTVRLDEAIRLLLPAAERLRRPARGEPVPPPRENGGGGDVLDLGVLRTAFGRVDADAVALLDSLTHILAGQAEAIAASIAAGDLLTAREAAHSAKGAAGSAGAVDAARRAAAVEAAAKAGDAEAARAGLVPLRSAINRLKEAVHAVAVDA